MHSLKRDNIFDLEEEIGKPKNENHQNTGIKPESTTDLETNIRTSMGIEPSEVQMEACEQFIIDNLEEYEAATEPRHRFRRESTIPESAFLTDLKETEGIGGDYSGDLEDFNIETIKDLDDSCNDNMAIIHKMLTGKDESKDGVQNKDFQLVKRQSNLEGELDKFKHERNLDNLKNTQEIELMKCIEGVSETKNIESWAFKIEIPKSIEVVIEHKIEEKTSFELQVQKSIDLLSEFKLEETWSFVIETNKSIEGITGYQIYEFFILKIESLKRIEVATEQKLEEVLTFKIETQKLTEVSLEFRLEEVFTLQIESNLTIESSSEYKIEDYSTIEIYVPQGIEGFTGFKLEEIFSLKINEVKPIERITEYRLQEMAFLIIQISVSIAEATEFKEVEIYHLKIESLKVVEVAIEFKEIECFTLVIEARKIIELATEFILEEVYSLTIIPQFSIEVATEYKLEEQARLKIEVQQVPETASIFKLEETINIKLHKSMPGLTLHKLEETASIIIKRSVSVEASTEYRLTEIASLKFEVKIRGLIAESLEEQFYITEELFNSTLFWGRFSTRKCGEIIGSFVEEFKVEQQADIDFRFTRRAGRQGGDSNLLEPNLESIMKRAKNALSIGINPTALALEDIPIYEDKKPEKRTFQIESSSASLRPRDVDRMQAAIKVKEKSHQDEEQVVMAAIDPTHELKTIQFDPVNEVLEDNEPAYLKISNYDPLTQENDFFQKQHIQEIENDLKIAESPEMPRDMEMNDKLAEQDSQDEDMDVIRKKKKDSWLKATTFNPKSKKLKNSPEAIADLEREKRKSKFELNEVGVVGSRVKKNQATKPFEEMSSAVKSVVPGNSGLAERTTKNHLTASNNTSKLSAKKPVTPQLDASKTQSSVLHGKKSVLMGKTESIPSKSYFSNHKEYQALRRASKLNLHGGQSLEVRPFNLDMPIDGNRHLQNDSAN